MRGRCGNAADAAADAQARRWELAWHAGASASTGGLVVELGEPAAVASLRMVPR
jgi:hypothetical protein